MCLRVLCVTLINYRYSNAPFSRLSFGTGTRGPIAWEVPSDSTHRKNKRNENDCFPKGFLTEAPYRPDSCNGTPETSVLEGLGSILNQGTDDRD